MIRQDVKLERSVNGDKCIWMQAGVVRRKECFNRFNCPECRFDRVMQTIADQNKGQISMVKSQRVGKVLLYLGKIRSMQ